MKRHRSILVGILVVIATFLVSCGSPKATVPTTYTDAQIVQLQNYGATLNKLRDRMSSELQTAILQKDWVEVGSFIHGPLGELRQKMNYVARQLLPQDRKAASATAEDLYTRLETIDAAATDGNYAVALENYRAALKDFNDFMRLIPSPAASA